MPNRHLVLNMQAYLKNYLKLYFSVVEQSNVFRRSCFTQTLPPGIRMLWVSPYLGVCVIRTSWNERDSCPIDIILNVNIYLSLVGRAGLVCHPSIGPSAHSPGPCLCPSIAAGLGWRSLGFAPPSPCRRSAITPPYPPHLAPSLPWCTLWDTSGPRPTCLARDKQSRLGPGLTSAQSPARRGLHCQTEGQHWWEHMLAQAGWGALVCTCKRSKYLQ